jgi:Copper type II ascorbate-dependent monooxygenase, C-terminal domain
MKSIVAGLIPVFFTACTPRDVDHSRESSVEIDPLAPPLEGQGIQLRMTKTIAPGSESYGCRFFQVPDDDLFVHEETVRFGRGGHHTLLYKTSYTAIPEKDEKGKFVNGAEVHDCSEGVTARWKVESVLGGSEIFDHPGMLRGLPDDVAVRLPGKTIVLMSVHYLNASTVPLEVDARVNLSTIAREKVKMEAGLLYLDNPLLHVPPMGASTARMRCPVSRELLVVNLQSHMHARGVSFAATVVNASSEPSKVIYETMKWIEPPVSSFEPYLTLHAGDKIETNCAYENHETRTIGYGPNSSDEMCQLIGPYFPRDENFETCARAGGDYAAEWVGEGLSDGATTRTCLECAPAVAGHEYVSCIFNACPAISERVSALVRCELAHGAGVCLAEKAALSQAKCKD